MDEEEASIVKRINEHPNPGDAECTLSVCDVLKGIGPFKDLKDRYFWPNSLWDNLPEPFKNRHRGRK